MSCVQWYRCPIERQQLKELMKRRDMPALRDTALWFILIITAGAIAYVSWGSWFAVPAFLVYGWLYGGNFIFCNRCGPCSAFIRTAKNARHRNRSR
nr:hypothetical protein [Nostoc sp. ChiQUE02]